MKRRTFLAMLALGFLAAPLSGRAQGTVYYEGRVQWVSGSTLILMTAEGFSIRVDLRRVDQTEYQGLRTGTRILVTGVISEDESYLIGLSIRQVRSDYQSP